MSNKGYKFWVASNAPPPALSLNRVKGNLKLLEVDVDSWEVLAGNRNEWRRSVKALCNSLEMKRLDYAELERNL